jgi:hypothetical protein
MLWYAAEPLTAIDMKRALALAQKSKIPKHLPYTIQRLAAIGSDDSKKLLKELNDRLGKMEHSHEQHEIQTLLAKVLGE